MSESTESAGLPTRKLATIEVEPCPTCFAAIPLNCVDSHANWHHARIERGVEVNRTKDLAWTARINEERIERGPVSVTGGGS